VTKTLTAHTFLNLTENETYYYQVRSQSTCGNWGSWSECRSFTTKPSVMATPDQFFPPEGYACVGSGGGISWNAIEAAGGYEVMLSQDGCASGAVYTPTSNFMTLPELAEGDWQWKVRSVHPCGDVSAWSDCHSFTVDATPPSAPTWVQSKSHLPAQWSSANELEMAWEVAIDDDCGLVFYQLLWNESDVPPPMPWFTGVPDAEYTTPPLDDGSDWWFHVWAQDGAGNFVASPVSAGPFRIDTTAPTHPVVEASPAPGVWSNATSLSAAWTGAQDDGSGLAGYRWLLDQAPGTDPLAAPVSPDSSDTFGPLAEGQHWLHLAVMDGVENWSPPLHVGPFQIDLTPPTATLDEPSSGTPLRHADPVTIRWTEGDALSGVAWIALWWSPDDYATLYPIAEGPPSQMGHAYNWTVPFVEGTELRLRLAVTDAAGNVRVVDEGRAHTVTRAVGVDGPVAGLPERLILGRNVPNPFNPQTEIHYGLPAEGPVRLVVFDASGRVVRTLVDGIQAGPAWHRVIWDGRSDNGRRVASGTYFYRLEAAGETRSRRMVLVK
jgi:hypothetical protein